MPHTSAAKSTRPRRRARAIGVSAGLCVALCGVTSLVGAAAASTSDAQVTITAGTLDVTTPSFQAVSATLSGAVQTLTTTPATPWTATDARGTGAAWTVVTSAGDLVSVGSPNRTIPSSALAITTGTITADTGADAATGMTGSTSAAFTTATGPGQTNVTLVDAPGNHRGRYALTPSLDITIPANAQVSYPGVPYTSTLTVTIS